MTPSSQAQGEPILGGAPRFVGREQELGWLERLLRDSAAGRPGFVALTGEAGVGKTRFLGELRALALREDLQVCYGRCAERAKVPYKPFLEALLGVIPGLDAGRRTLEAGIIRRSLDPGARRKRTATPAGDDAAEKLLLFQTVASAVLRITREHPMLLALDDFHWSDQASLDLLAHLVFSVSDAATTGPVHLLIVVAARTMKPTEPTAMTLERLRREPISGGLDLSGFGETEVRELVRALKVDRPARQLISTICEATGGNPLFVEEVVRHLRKRDALRLRGGYVVATMTPADLRLPDEITAAIATRAEGISDACREVLVHASFLGDRFSAHLLAAVTREVEERVLRLLEEAMHAYLVESEGERFRFVHPLLRHAFYNEPSTARRRLIHRNVAICLEQLDRDPRPERLLEIAHHWVAADTTAEPEEILARARSAGDRACDLFAWDEAAEFYEAALKAAARGAAASPVDLARIHCRAALAHQRHADAGPCLDHYEEAIRLFELGGDRAGAAEAIVGMTRARLTLAVVPYGSPLAVDPLQRALEGLSDRDPALAGRILATMSQAHWVGARPEPAREAARRALEIGERIADERLCAEAGHALALAQIQATKPKPALESWHASLRHARRVGDPWLEAAALARIPLTLSLLGRFREAEDVAREACAVAAESHDWAAQSVARAALVSVAVARGDFDDAEKHAQETMTMVRRSRYPWGGAIALPALACARFLRGRLDQAEDALAALVEPGSVFEEAGVPMQFMAWFYRQLCRAHSAPSEAMRTELSPIVSLGPWRRTSDVHSVSMLCALVEMGDRLERQQFAAVAEERLATAAAEGIIVTSGWGSWPFSISRVRGLAAALARRWDDAENFFERALEETSACGARPELGRSCLDYARMLAVRGAVGDREKAGGLAERAAEIFYKTGMDAFVGPLGRVCESLGVPPLDPPVAGGARDFSEHEKAILVSVARGRTDREIAADTVLSAATVARETDELMKRIGIERRAIPVYAAGKGWIARVQPAVVMFTDMEASSALMNRLGDRRGVEIIRRHDAIVRGSLRRHEGPEIKHTGDGFMAAFSSASSALRCAIDIQRAFARRNRENRPAIRVRIGINAGEPVAEQGQLFGNAVNLAARICARARAGQILAGESVRPLAAGAGIAFVDRGRVALKGFPKRCRLFEVPWRNKRRPVAR
ncbi:MAG: AAA family ATPase [Candidatus Binatia bacterium]